MAKGQHLSTYQRGIVKRYYQNIDTLSLHRLSEAVSELYLCEDDRKAVRLWANVESALKKVKADPKRVAVVMTHKNVRDLAALVNELSGGK
ncbi:MAG: hypothetical protein IT438_13285 [Phycisphaerales bacterium]|nr:hypothetical protein [Phycisphaerales bacterium]